MPARWELPPKSVPDAVHGLTVDTLKPRAALLVGTPPTRKGELAAIVIAALSARTIARNAEYSSALSIWETSVARYPHGRARLGYATELLAAGRHDDAVQQLREAVRDYPKAKFALGVELASVDSPVESAAMLRAFVAEQHDAQAAAEARTLLAHIASRESLQKGQQLLLAGELPESIAALRTAVEADPHSSAARTLLGEAYVRSGDTASAMIELKEALRMRPNYAPAHNALGAAFASAGRFSEALAEFRRAVELDPADPGARNNLNRLLGSARAGR